MLDNRFYKYCKSNIHLKDLLQIDDNISINKNYSKNTDLSIKYLSTIDEANNGDLTFFTTSLIDKEKIKKQLLHTKASYIIMQKQYININKNIVEIISENPYLTFIKICKQMLIENNDNIKANSISKTAKISKHTSIGNGVKIGANTIIEDFVKIEDGVEIGDNCIIMSGVKIGHNCIIGNNCKINENCVIKFAEIGDNCCIHSNSSIGQDGFGYLIEQHLNQKIPHFSYVIIGNNVEIGANTCIDRGVFNPTIIENNVKIDNLVQIGHNVKIGENSILCGQTGIAGSAKIDKNCILGARTGILNNVKIGKNSIVHSTSLLTKDFCENSKIIGNPAEIYKKWTRKHAKINLLLRKKLCN